MNADQAHQHNLAFPFTVCPCSSILHHFDLRSFTTIEGARAYAHQQRHAWQIVASASGALLETSRDDERKDPK